MNPSLPPLFGMFVQPMMLCGLAGAAAPIIIHLLNRRRFKQMEWAAMQWLLAAIRKNARRLRIEQLLLLALRTALIASLALAMAMPLLESARLLPATGQRTHKVIVLDASYSMDYRTADRSRFERGREFAGGIIKHARPGDQVSIILMADPPRVLGQPSPSLGTVAAELDALKVGHGPADVPATLEKALAVLAQSPLDRKELWILTDLQRNSWMAESGPRGDSLRALCRKLDGLAPATLVDLGQTTFENLAVSSLEVRAPLVLLNQTVGIQASVHNFGSAPARRVPLQLRIDGVDEARELVDVEAGRNALVDFNASLATAGDHLVEVSIPQGWDPLGIDDHRYLVLPVREQIQVLLVDGKPSGEPFQAATDYLRYALDPQPEGESGGGVIRQEVVPPSALGERELGAYDCLFLCNVDRFTEAEARTLDNYLRQGGGLVIFLGDQVDVDNYNRLLFAGGKGLLPAKLGAVEGSADRTGKGFRFDPLRYEHEIVRNFQGQGPDVLAGLLNAHTFAYIRAVVPAHGTARPVLNFQGAGGDPAIVEKPVHRGEVVLVTTSASTAWTAWPVKPSYPAVVNDMLRFAIRGRSARKTTTVGQPLLETLPPLADEAPVTVVLPDPNLRPELRQLKPGGEVSQFRFDATELSGPYRVRFGPPLAKEEVFAVNVDPRESDLTKLEANELHRALPDWRVSVITATRWPGNAPREMDRPRGELYRYLLGAVLGMLLLESFLAWKFGHYART